jgi:hypothetical protein
MKKRSLLLLLAAAGAGLLLVAALLRRPEPVQSPPPPKPSAIAQPPLPAPPVVVRPKEPEGDPLLHRWSLAISLHNQKDVLEAQATFLAREGEYREPLMKAAEEERDPRVRAFTVAVLGRMKSRPPESYFMARLSDAEEYPRTSACQALERFGSSACLPDLDRLAAGDPAAAVRAAAAQAAKAVRSR